MLKQRNFSHKFVAVAGLKKKIPIGKSKRH